MQIGSRKIEEGEPVIYFDDIKMSALTEQDNMIIAHGGWGDIPHVVWDERSEITFQLSHGVMSQIEMSLWLGTNAVKKTDRKIYVPKREGPLELDSQHRLYLKHWPYLENGKKAFIYGYDRQNIQRKMYGKRIFGLNDGFGEERPCIEVYEDKGLEIPADTDDQYVVDYYYEYKDEALTYAIQQERFNGLFTLEAKFYSKDENEGIEYTNILYMPKVKIASDINLRLGERADPTVSTFNIIGLPETTGEFKNLIVDITRLNEDIDGDI